MIIGNSISGPAVAVDRLLADVADKRHESETRLAFGATKNEAILPAMRSAILAAMIPNLNMMSVVGLVSIPGEMGEKINSRDTKLFSYIDFSYMLVLSVIFIFIPFFLFYVNKIMYYLMSSKPVYFSSVIAI